jgi:methionine sulfoxide reductase heme-binding subunit
VTDPTPHVFWITSRAAGTAALVLTSLSVSLGLVMAIRVKLRRRGPETRALHEALALAGLASIAIHGVSLVGDRYMHPSLVDIAVPFAGSYRTGWTAAGIVAGWTLAVLGLSYYVRGRIGAARWRSLHRLSTVAWGLGVAHSLGEGTDAGQVWFLAMAAVVAVPALLLVLVRSAQSGGEGKNAASRPPRAEAGQLDPQPAAAGHEPPGRVGTMEAVEDSGALIDWDAWPVILDREADATAASRDSD